MTGGSTRWDREHGDDGHRDGDPCAQVRVDLGCYVLGALEPAERIAVDEHLAHCADCRSELAALAEMPALLGRLTESEAAHGLAVDPSPAMLDDLLAAAATERRQSRRRTLLSVAAVALVAVLGAGVLTSVLTNHDHTAVTTTVTAQGVAATADLRSASDGTSIDLQIRGVQAGERCRLVVVDSTGRQQVVSEWQVDYEGTARVHATTDVARKKLTQLRVVTVSGTGLADLSVPAV